MYARNYHSYTHSIPALGIVWKAYSMRVYYCIKFLHTVHDTLWSQVHVVSSSQGGTGDDHTIYMGSLGLEHAPLHQVCAQ